LHETHQIKVGDLERILRVIQNITDYLYNRYGEYKTIEREVEHMRKTIFDPKNRKEAKLEGKLEGKKEGKLEGKKEGKEEVAKRMLLKGLDIETIVEFTGFTKEEVEQLQQ
jgi:predicted transposase/invertase (TIGR01784 family)